MCYKILTSLLLIFSLSGCLPNYPATNNNLTSDSEYAEPLTLEQVIEVLTQSGIMLSSYSDNSFAVFDNISPATFKITGTDDILLIYVFDSIADRIKIFNDLFNYEDLQDLFPEFSFPSKAKNVMLIHIFDASSTEHDEFIRASEKLGLISKTVWEKLNDLERIIFTGAGENWQAHYLVEFHAYRYKDENNIDRYDRVGKARFSLKPKFDIQDQLKIVYEYKTNSHGSSGTTYISSNEFNSLGGGGHIPLEADVYTFTIEWEGQKEVFEMRSEI